MQLRSVMSKIRIDGIIYSGPSSWEELDCEGLLAYAKVMSSKDLSEAQIQHQLVMRLMHIPYSLYKKLPETERLKTHEAIDWIYNPNNISAWLIPVIKSGRTKLFGPEDGLSDITGEEFMYSELAYERYLFDKNPDHAIDIFSALYRKRRFWSTDRRLFSGKFMEKLERAGNSMSPVLKEAILINYAGCRNQIIALHPHVWVKKLGTGADGDDIDGQKTSWASLFLDIAGDKFGDYKSTLRTNLWHLLKDMDKKAQNAESIKQP